MLVGAYESGDSQSMRRLESHFQPERKLRWEALKEELKLARDGKEFALEDAREMVVRAHGYRSWEEL